MRFGRTDTFVEFQDTRRKRLALARKHRLERERLPLFAKQIAEQQPDADTVMAERAERWVRWQQERRDTRAANWRRARAKLFTYGDNIRAVLRRLWNEAPYPAAPEYLADMLHRYDTGRLDPDNPPWIYRGPGLSPNLGEAMACIRREARARAGLLPLEVA